MTAATLLGRAAALLMILGLLSGFLVSGGMTKQMPVEPHAAHAAHLNAILGCFFMIAVAWSLPMLKYGEKGQKRLALAVIAPNYAN